jgi:diguanylate cyclase (GGDEF)-like protein
MLEFLASRVKGRSKGIYQAAFCAAACALFALPARSQQKSSNLADSSLEDLMNVQVTSVSKKEQKISQVAAAIFVITQEDIRRSGATNIPDLLRMVPGLDVAQINGNTWAISSRGFNLQFANKLLVLIDGRAVYSPLFGGVDFSNRGVSLDALRRERSRQTRESGSFAIILLDIDHFKYVNDTYGHPAGDAVLTEAAQRIKSCIRPYDTLGRYGGEEFLIVLPTADGPGAVCVAERIREAFESEPFVTERDKIAITVSLGVAASGGRNTFNAEALLQLADEALYRAKQMGRNRVELAIPPDDIDVTSAEQPPVANDAIKAESL